MLAVAARTGVNEEPDPPIDGYALPLDELPSAPESAASSPFPCAGMTGLSHAAAAGEPGSTAPSALDGARGARRIGCAPAPEEAGLEPAPNVAPVFVRGDEPAVSDMRLLMLLACAAAKAAVALTGMYTGPSASSRRTAPEPVNVLALAAREPFNKIRELHPAGSPGGVPGRAPR